MRLRQKIITSSSSLLVCGSGKASNIIMRMPLKSEEPGQGIDDYSAIQVDNLLPPVKIILDGSASQEQFASIGEGMVSVLLLDRAKLRPDEKVLDAGCGIGRNARPLTKYLNGYGRYMALTS